MFAFLFHSISNLVEIFSELSLLSISHMSSLFRLRLKPVLIIRSIHKNVSLTNNGAIFSGDCFFLFNSKIKIKNIK